MRGKGNETKVGNCTGKEAETLLSCAPQSLDTQSRSWVAPCDRQQLKLGLLALSVRQLAAPNGLSPARRATLMSVGGLQPQSEEMTQRRRSNLRPGETSPGRRNREP